MESQHPDSERRTRPLRRPGRDGRDSRKKLGRELWKPRESRLRREGKRENQLQYMQHRLTAVRIKMCPLDLEWGQG